MPQFRLFRSRKTDEQFIEMTRTFLRRWDKLRFPAILACLLLIAACFFTAAKTAKLLMGFQPGAGQAILAGMAMGAGMGMIFGFLIYQLLEFLVKAIAGNFRSERLMLKYHDALLQLARTHSSVIPADTPVEESISRE